MVNARLAGLAKSNPAFSIANVGNAREPLEIGTRRALTMEACGVPGPLRSPPARLHHMTLPGLILAAAGGGSSGFGGGGGGGGGFSGGGGGGSGVYVGGGAITAGSS